MFKKIKHNKKTILACIICSLIVGTVGVSATTLLYSKDVVYDNSSSGLRSTNLQDALDELYAKAKSAPECDSDGNCTVTCPSGTSLLSISTGYKCGVPAGYQILSKVEVVTTGDGLYADNTEEGRYYYTGSNPNNKIVFNGEPYRILSIESDGRVKIIKMVYITRERWHGATRNIAWTSAELNIYLNDTWLLTQENGEDYQYLMDNNKWYVGTVSSSTDLSNIEAVYTSEKKEKEISAVGLISVSEYLKSKYSGSTFLSFYGTWWTISESYNSSDEGLVWYVNGYGGNLSRGYSGNSDSYETRAVFPVLYLKASVSLTGSGTSTDPYCISGSSCPTNLNFTQRSS